MLELLHNINKVLHKYSYIFTHMNTSEELLHNMNTSEELLWNTNTSKPVLYVCGSLWFLF